MGHSEKLYRGKKIMPHNVIEKESIDFSCVTTYIFFTRFNFFFFLFLLIVKRLKNTRVGKLSLLKYIKNNFTAKINIDIVTNYYFNYILNNINFIRGYEIFCRY